LQDVFDINNFPKARNRKEARALTKALRNQGVKKNEVANMVELAKDLAKHPMSEESTSIPEGTKVKLDYHRLISQAGWHKLDAEYRSFVSCNMGTVFTVEYEERFGDNPQLVALKEDTCRQKWMFNVANLIIVKSEGGEQNINE